MNKKKIIGASIGVALFAILIAGATFAWLTLNANVTNGIYNSSTVCFDIDYSNGGSISGELNFITDATTGLNTSVTMGINSSCDISGNGTIYLNVSDDTDDVLISTVDGHCEATASLVSIPQYTDSSTCVSNGGTWITSGTALKYSVYARSNPGTYTIPLSVGYINTTGDIALYEDFALSEGSTTTYYIYIWLDGVLATYNHSGKYFSGYIHTKATQVEE